MSHSPTRSTTSNSQSERSPPTSPAARSINSHLSHVPQTPSRLRHSFAPGSPSPEQLTTTILYGVSPEAEHNLHNLSDGAVTFGEDGIHPHIHNDAIVGEIPESTRVRGHIEEEYEHGAASENSRLLNHHDHTDSNYNHGTFSTGASSTRRGRYEEISYEGRRVNNTEEQSNRIMSRLRPYLGRVENWMNTSGHTTPGDESAKDGRRGRIPKSWRTYLPYYIPILKCEFYFGLQ